MTVTTPAFEPNTAIARQLRLAGMVLAFLILGVGGLSLIVGVNGAVIAPGQLVVASDVKKIQHPTGGVVAEIRVEDGDRVHKGDVLLALDPTVASANANIVGASVDELMAEQARLEAERDARPIRWPAELTTRRSAPEVADVMADEERLFRLRTSARQGDKAQLTERIHQAEQEIAGEQKQIEAKTSEVALIQQELVGVRKLYAQGLVPLTRLNSLERGAVELNGDIGQLQAAIASARGHIAETRLQILQVDQDARSQAGNQLTDVQNKLSEMRQRKVTADQEYRRVLIRAPQDGVVDRLAVHTIGGVIAPGEAIMLIVPDKDSLHVEARVRPMDVDQVQAGRSATLRFSAFNVRSTPEIKGKVTRVSAETRQDEKTGVSYYTVDIAIPPEQRSRLRNLELVPGMPVESFIQTGRRSILSFLTKPLTDQLKRSFRED